MPIGQRVVFIGGGHNALIAAFYLAKGGFKPLVLERSDVASRQLSRGLEVARVGVERPAASLPGGDDPLHAVAREHVDGRGVDIGIEHLLRATGQQRHSRAARSL